MSMVTKKSKMEKHSYVYKCPNFTANLNNMRLNNKWCDVTIKVNEREFHAHKVILAANLNYFEAMLSNDSFQESKEGIITMQSIQAADLEAFISYAYTGEILLTESNALNLLAVANYLNEDGIKEACIEFLKKHLNAEEACRAYKIASFIECLSLKNAAKATIIANFGICSYTTEYLDLDFESLTNILSDGKAQPVKLQQTFFEGIMKWIVHDVENRKIHMNDLLTSINIAKLTDDDLIGYLCANVVDHNDEHSIIKDVMHCYHASKIKEKEQLLMIVVVGFVDEKLQFQFYDFIEKKWSPLEEISDGVSISIHPCSAVLNDKLYYMVRNAEINHLEVFNFITKRSTSLPSSSSILNYHTMCACNRFLYLCGGIVENNSPSDQALRYDPQTNSLETLPPMKTTRSGAAAIFYQGCLLILGGHDGSRVVNSVERYDPDTMEWTAFPPMRETRLLHATAVLDGKLYACGGCYDNTAEVYDTSTESWQPIDSMNEERSRFILIVSEGKLLAIGGDKKKTVEVYDPCTNEWRIDRQKSSGLQIQYVRGGWIGKSSETDAKLH